MKLSWLRMFQWIGILAALVFAVALRFEAPSEAGMRMNASPESPLSQSLRGYWKLDDGSGTNATDASGNGNTLAMTGSPSWTTGNIGPYALDFSGSGQYLFVASPSSALDFADGASFTITGWFNRDTFANDHTILSTKSGQSTESDGYIAYIDDATDQLIIRFDENGTTDARTFTSTSTFTSTGWHHFALSWNESAPDAILYIDGKPDGSGSGTAFASMGNLANTNAFYIGAETDAGNPFDGKLDDIRIYGYALSADQVKKVYNTTSPTQPVDTSLVGHWTFDGPDIQGTTAIDRSSYGNNGTITGAVPTMGKLGQALSFNRNNRDYISVSDPANGSLDFGTADFSVSAWLRVYDFDAGHVVVSKKNSLNNNYAGFGVWFFPASSWFTFDLGDWGNVCQFVATYGPTVGEWFHFVLQRNGSALQAYINGQYNSGDTCTTVGNISNSEPFIIGDTSSHSTQSSLSGAVDDVRVYNRALSATEALNLYMLGK